MVQTDLTVVGINNPKLDPSFASLPSHLEFMHAITTVDRLNLDRVEEIRRLPITVRIYDANVTKSEVDFFEDITCDAFVAVSKFSRKRIVLSQPLQFPRAREHFHPYATESNSKMRFAQFLDKVFSRNHDFECDVIIEEWSSLVLRLLSFFRTRDNFPGYFYARLLALAGR